jgi:hypothetical protein
MPRHQTPAQKETVERVMHEFKHGELKTARGTRKVKNRKQAIAIALHEAGASKNESPAENKRNLHHTKAKERRGETYRDEAEGKKSRSKSAASGSSTRKSSTRKATARKAPARKTAARKTSARGSTARSRNADRRGGERTKAELYAKAKRRNIPGRSKMDKAQLQRALQAH